MPKPINYLKNMKISEISLVTDPACPGADVLFTKGTEESGIQHVQLFKRDVSDEPRDNHGRWTRGAVAAMGHVAGTARQIAQGLSDRARQAATAVANNRITNAIGARANEAANSAVGNAANVVRTTKPRGAFPVHGGGVQFDFEHMLTTGHKIDTSVQIRPEHLEGSRHLQRGLAGLHQILLTGGGDIKHPFGDRETTAGATPRASWWRANVTRTLFGNGNSTTQNSGSNANSQLSGNGYRGPGGFDRTGAFGLPVYEHLQDPGKEPEWSRQIRNASGVLKQSTANGHHVPNAGADYTSAGGWAHHYNGDFIPTVRPDVQKGIERVRDYLASDPERGRQIKQAMQKDKVGPGKAYFTFHGNYVPPGAPDFQQSIERKYKSERDRLDTVEADAKSHVREAHSAPAPQKLFHADPGVGDRAVKSADDEIDRFIRERGVTKVPSGTASGAGSQHEHFGGHKPTVAKRLFK